MHAQPSAARCLLGRRGLRRSAPSRTIRKPSSKTSRRSTSEALARNRRQGPWPHRAPPLCRRHLSGATASTGAARRCASNASARSSRPAINARAIEVTWSLTSFGTDRASNARGASGPSVTTGTSKTGCVLRARLHLRRRPLPGVCASNLACLTNVRVRCRPLPCP